MGNEQKIDAITFKNVKAPDYRVIHANGAFGGLTPHGELFFNLYFEHPAGPDEIVHSMTADGLGPEIERRPAESPITRFARIGVVMSMESARSFAHWISSHVQRFDERHKEQDNGS